MSRSDATRAASCQHWRSGRQYPETLYLSATPPSCILWTHSTRFLNIHSLSIHFTFVSQADSALTASSNDDPLTFSDTHYFANRPIQIFEFRTTVSVGRKQHGGRVGSMRVAIRRQRRRERRSTRDGHLVLRSHTQVGRRGDLWLGGREGTRHGRVSSVCVVVVGWRAGTVRCTVVIVLCRASSRRRSTVAAAVARRPSSARTRDRSPTSRRRPRRTAASRCAPTSPASWDRPSDLSLSLLPPLYYHTRYSRPQLHAQ